ncbi:DUF4377 domain-containing protein [Porphyromonas levii]|nr:DUF4377 domain-containing protein [Porphyromonas levii]MBR8758919.1 hypothetical protein [Porphyromonas levii]MBR8801834.1 hypothetical protein [Porphyromonas levii]
MIKRLLLLLITIIALGGCSKPDVTSIKLRLEVIIVKEHKDPSGRFITWPQGADIESDPPILLDKIKDFTYEEGYRYILPVRIQLENGEESYSYFEWDGHKLIKEKKIDGRAR